MLTRIFALLEQGNPLILFIFSVLIVIYWRTVLVLVTILLVWVVLSGIVAVAHLGPS